MATQTIVQLIDDLNGQEITGTGETVSFGLDGQSFEIDLSPENAAELRELMSRYVEAGRTSAAPVRATARRQGSTNRQETQKARAWLKDNGHEVSDRGRIPAQLWEAYITGQSAYPGTNVPSADDETPEVQTDEVITFDDPAVEPGDDADTTPVAEDEPSNADTPSGTTESDDLDAKIIAWAESKGLKVETTKAGRPTSRMVRRFEKATASAE